MTSINRLNQVDAVEDGDIIPLWEASSGRTRGALASTVKEYLEEGLDIEGAVLAAYQKFRSFSGFAVATLPTVFNVISSGNVGGPYNIMHLALPSVGGEVRGDGFTTNADSTITVNRDMFACVVNANLVARYTQNDNVVVGIGIGDPSAIPTAPGVQVGENYVSRFRCARRGDGVNDEVTWDLYVAPVGKSTTDIQVFGLRAGDKIFPVIWTQEVDSAEITIVEGIFTAEEISI